jgi:hypothetical protein
MTEIFPDKRENSGYRDAALALLQMAHPIVARILYISWKVLISNIMIEVLAPRSITCQVTDVVFRHSLCYPETV